MSDENAGFPPENPGTPLTPEQEEYLRQQTVAQAVSSPSAAAGQAAAAAQMTERGPLLPAEAQMDALMEAFKQQSAQIAALQSQLGTMQKQQEEALAASGGPMITRYAQGAADKITAHVAANPDVPAGHFAALTGFADNLLEQAKAMSKGQPVLTEVENAASSVTRFITRTHPRLSGKHIDWSAVLDDVETVVEEAVKLAA